MKKKVIIILCSFGLCFNLYSQQCSAGNTSPSNASTLYTLTPTLNWNITNTVSCSPCGYNSYFVSVAVSIATDQQFNNIIYNYYSNTIIYSHTIPAGNLQYNTTYWWRINFQVIANCVNPCMKQTCNASSNPFSFNTAITGIEKIGFEVPDKFSLYQNYPNPFNPVTKIRFSIPAVGAQYIEPVQLKVYDILGREAATLVNQNLSPGTYEVEWNANNYPGGVYYYKLVTDRFSETKKMILIK